jgi:SAM-dependent methyltransferase
MSQDRRGVIDAPFGYGAPHDPQDGRITAPAALRNAPHIAAELVRLAPKRGRVLELASGTGEHAIRFAPALPGLSWQPTEVDPERLASIAAWAAHSPAPNLLPPRRLDATAPGWSRAEAPVEMAVLINLLHLLPEPSVRVLLTEMAQALAPGGKAVVYGPFLRDGKTTSEGDSAFHARIQVEIPGAGYKDVAWVCETLRAAGAEQREIVAMPANNLLLVFGR